MSNTNYSPYSQHHNQSIGRVLHYLYLYCNLNVAEQATIGGGPFVGTVTYGGKQIATFRWKGTTPDFSFIDEYAYAQENQCRLNKQLLTDTNHLDWIKGRIDEFVAELQELKHAATDNPMVAERLDELVVSLPFDKVAGANWTNRLVMSIRAEKQRKSEQRKRQREAKKAKQIE